jgi:hypothetical protein
LPLSALVAKQACLRQKLIALFIVCIFAQSRG